MRRNRTNLLFRTRQLLIGAERWEPTGSASLLHKQCDMYSSTVWITPRRAHMRNFIRALTRVRHARGETRRAFALRKPGLGLTPSPRSATNRPQACLLYAPRAHASSAFTRKDPIAGVLAVRMVPEARLELARCRHRWILSPLRLPIPPLGRTLWCVSNYTILKEAQRVRANFFPCAEH